MTAPIRHVAVAMLGARRHYAVPRALASAGLLGRFFTDVFVGAGISRWASLAAPITAPGLRRLGQRTAAGVPAAETTTFPLFGLRRALINRMARTPAQRMRAYAQWNRRFGELVLRHWSDSADAVYGFNAAALEIAAEAKRRGLPAIVDQTAAPWSIEEPLLADERHRWPGWEFEGSAPDDWRPLAEREFAEWALADRIVCGSNYVADTVRSAGGPAEKCAVVPYGVDSPAANLRPRTRRGGPLRVLFVGTVQLRKGIQYVAEAAGLLSPGTAVFRAVGAVRVSGDARRLLAQHIDLRGALSRADVRQEYEWADVLAAPSLSEGSANVCYEALACGLPVITTPNTGSVVRHQADGFVVGIRSSRDLADAIGQLASSKDLVETFSANALDRAREFSFDRYARDLCAVVTGRSTNTES